MVENVPMVLAITEGPGEETTYVLEEIHQMQSVLEMREAQLSMSESISAEYFAQVSAQFSFTYTTKEEYKKELDKDKKQAHTVTRTLAADQVSLKWVKVDIYPEPSDGGDQKYWLMPTSGVGYHTVTKPDSVFPNVPFFIDYSNMIRQSVPWETFDDFKRFPPWLGLKKREE